MKPLQNKHIHRLIRLAKGIPSQKRHFLSEEEGIA